MTRTRRRNRLMVALAVPLLLSAACANDGGSDAAGTETGTNGTTASTGATGEDDSMIGGGYGGGGGGDQSDDGSENGSEITLSVNSFLFDPAELEVPSGTVISVKNDNAQTPHTFTVKGTDIDLGLEPLETEDAKIDLDPGTYDFHCRLHAQMTGTLTVT